MKAKYILEAIAALRKAEAYLTERANSDQKYVSGTIQLTHECQQAANCLEIFSGLQMVEVAIEHQGNVNAVREQFDKESA